MFCDACRLSYQDILCFLYIIELPRSQEVVLAYLSMQEQLSQKEKANLN